MINIKDVNVALAKACGLPVDGLQSFELKVFAGTVPILCANYIVRDPSGRIVEGLQHMTFTCTHVGDAPHQPADYETQQMNEFAIEARRVCRVPPRT